MKRWVGVSLVLMVVMACVTPGHGAISARAITERFACTAGESLSAGDIIAIKAADGLCYKADADSATLRPAVGWVAAAYSSSATVTAISRGRLTGFTGLTPGAPVFLGTTAGAYTQTAPVWPQVVGYATSATEVQIAIGPSAKTQTFVVHVENLSAGTDIGDGAAANARTVRTVPRGITLTAAWIYGLGSAAGIDASNTAAISIYNGTNTVVTKTYSNSPAWPAAYTPSDLGTLSNASVAAGAALKFDIVNGTTADPPAFDIVIEYVGAD